MQASAPGVRDRILDAAEQLIASIGGANLTLDAVAQKAGVSKGGLLYHYPSKDALLLALIDRHLDRTDQRCAQVRAQMPDHPSSDLKAWVVAMLQPDPLRDETGAALFGAALHNPELLAGIRKRYADQVAALTQLPCSFPLTATILLAVDGLLFGEVWHLTPYTAAQRVRIIEQLLSLADHAFDTHSALENSSS